MNAAYNVSVASSRMEMGSMHAMSGASPWVPSDGAAAGGASDTASPLAGLRNAIRQNSQDFKALKAALSSNDPAAASQAFATVQKDIQSASQAAGGVSPFDPTSPIGKDFQALGEALKSGDIAGAKQAFAAFRHDIRAAGRVARSQANATSLSTPPPPPPPPQAGQPGSLFSATA